MPHKIGNVKEKESPQGELEANSGFSSTSLSNISEGEDPPKNGRVIGNRDTAIGNAAKKRTGCERRRTLLFLVAHREIWGR
jgi:hypothetical protein